MAKYLDYDGLKKFKDNLDKVMGADYKIAETDASIKEYIDSRIFVGSEIEINAALAKKEIDETTFIVCTDEDSKEIASITDADVNNLFK